MSVFYVTTDLPMVPPQQREVVFGQVGIVRDGYNHQMKMVFHCTCTSGKQCFDCGQYLRTNAPTQWIAVRPLTTKEKNIQLWQEITDTWSDARLSKEPEKWKQLLTELELHKHGSCPTARRCKGCQREFCQHLANYAASSIPQCVLCSPEYMANPAHKELVCQCLGERAKLVFPTVI